MSDWTIAANAVNDLRRFLNDGPQDRLVKQKIVIGAIDGSNTEFFTFEDRIVDTSLVVTVNFTPVTAVVDDAVQGLFHTAVPPVIDDTVRARYFYQYFLDDELLEALNMGADQINQVDDVTKSDPTMKNAILFYAGGFAYQKQAMRWAERMSMKFLVEEEPLQAEALNRSNLFKQISDGLYKRGEWFRDDVYKRAGRRNIPAFGVYKPNVRPVGTVR